MEDAGNIARATNSGILDQPEFITRNLKHKMLTDSVTRPVLQLPIFSAQLSVHESFLSKMTVSSDNITNNMHQTA